MTISRAHSGEDLNTNITRVMWSRNSVWFAVAKCSQSKVLNRDKEIRQQFNCPLLTISNAAAATETKNMR